MASPNMWKQISIKVDLLTAAPIYIDFLRKVNEEHGLTNESVVRKLVHRYEHFWLPLLAEWQQTDLEPPLDIRWIWHLHILHRNLQGYTDYCKERFDRVLPHSIRFNTEETKFATDRTRLIWKDNFPGEPFDIDLSEVEKETNQENGTKLSHLVTFALKEQNFFYQISLPQYIDGSFLYSAVDRYRQLLLFRKLRPDIRNMCLPYDIQLIWRVHLLHPIEYHQEIHRILGNGLEDLGNTVVHPKDILSGEFSDPWKSVLNTELFVPGTGPRGPASPLQLINLPKEVYGSAVVEEADLTINDLLVKDLWTPANKIVTQARLLKQSLQTYDEIFRLKGVPNEKLSSKDVDGLGKFHFDARANRGIEFHVYGTTKRCCSKEEKHISTIFFNPRQAFPNMSFVTQSLQIDIPKISYTDCEISLVLKAKAGVLKPHSFGLNREGFFGVSLPSDLRPFVVSLPPWYGAITVVEHEDKAEFILAKHSLTNKREGADVSFTCQVLKQEDLNLSAVMLYKNDGTLCCVGYSVGGKHLPSKDQVTSSCPLNFDETAEDYAMLIKNYKGDYAVVIARWIADPESPTEGKVSFHVYYLQGNPNVDQFDVRDDEHQSIKMSNGTIVDLPTGRVTVDSRSKSLPEDITQAFCVGTLFVTCQKKPMGMIPGVTNGSVRSTKTGQTESEPAETPRSTSRFNKKATKNRKLSRKRKMSASFTYLLACGLQIDAALYGSMGPSLASSRASSLSNLIKSASQGSFTVSLDENNIQQHNPVEQMPMKDIPAEDKGIVIPSRDGSVINPAVESDVVTNTSDSPQTYMDIKL